MYRDCNKLYAVKQNLIIVNEINSEIVKQKVLTTYLVIMQQVKTIICLIGTVM